MSFNRFDLFKMLKRSKKKSSRKNYKTNLTGLFKEIIYEEPLIIMIYTENIHSSFPGASNYALDNPYRVKIAFILNILIKSMYYHLNMSHGSNNMQ